MIQFDAKVTFKPGRIKGLDSAGKTAAVSAAEKALGRPLTPQERAQAIRNADSAFKKLQRDFQREMQSIFR